MPALPALLCLALSACHTRPLPPASLDEPGWAVQQGQAVWRARADAPELAGELLYAQSVDGRSLIQFTKTPFPFIIAQRTPGGWQLEVPGENKVYSGPGDPPRRIGWFHLPIALAGVPPPAPWVFTRDPAAGWTLRNAKTGEEIAGYLSP